MSRESNEAVQDILGKRYYFKGGRVEKIDEFIKKHERLINSISNRFSTLKDYDKKDRLNIGRVVCWKCYKRYKNYKGAKFTTYLTKAVLNEYSLLARTLKFHKKKIVKYIDYCDDLYSFDKKLYVDNIRHRSQRASIKEKARRGKEKEKTLFNNVFAPVDRFKEKEIIMDINKIFQGRHRDIAILLWQGYSQHAAYKRLRKHYRSKKFNNGRNYFQRDLSYIKYKLSIYLERGI